MIIDSVQQADAVDFMSGVEDCVFDAIITDPPYGVTEDTDDYVAIGFLEQAYRIMKPDSALMMCVGQRSLREFWNEAERVGFKWLNTIVWWHRNTLSRQSKKFAFQYDPILYFAKGNFQHRLDHVRIKYRSHERLQYSCNNSKKKGWRPNPDGARCPDVWDDIPAVTTTSNAGNDPKYEHKWQKPVRLFDRMIKATCAPGTIMLDPFCGSGTALVAAKMNDVHYIGVDCESHYVEMSKKRLLGNLAAVRPKSKPPIRDIFG